MHARRRPARRQLGRLRPSRSLGQLGLVAAAAATAAVLAPAVAAEATEVRTTDGQRLLGDIRIERLEVQLGGGAVARGDLLRFQESDPDVELRSALARGTVAGTEPMEPLAARALSRGGVAGINGGYRLPRAPWGAPNGLFVDRGRLEQGQVVNSNGRPTGRGMVGWRRHGQVVMDRISVTHHYERSLAAGDVRPVDELNRQPRAGHDGEVIAFTDRFGTPVTVPRDAVVLTIDGLELRSTGASSGEVAAVARMPADTTLPVPDGQHLLVATGTRAAELLDVAPGERFTISTTIAPEATAAGSWDELHGGVAGGQLLVRDGVRRPADEWGSFAAFGDDGRHTDLRRARTAIGRTGAGEVLLVTIDENRSGSSGWSAGVTVRELADVMLGLGAQDAVNLDGGGSTAFTVNGEVRNRQSDPGRHVMDGLFLHVASPAAARDLAAACDEQVVLAGAGFTDVTAGSTHAQAIGCLAGWGVTTGVTATSYDPSGTVTRAQMASFLARWIDDHAVRGTGIELASVADLPFDDVRAGSTHAAAIARLADAGILQGRDSTTFAPGGRVTRGQTASMVSRTIEHVAGSAVAGGRDTFIDDNGTTHESNVDRLAATGIITGTGGFIYRPNSDVSRQAMASILMRATAELVEAGIATPPPDGPVLASDSAEVTQEASG